MQNEPSIRRQACARALLKEGNPMSHNLAFVYGITVPPKDLKNRAIKSPTHAPRAANEKAARGAVFAAGRAFLRVAEDGPRGIPR